MIDSIYQIRVLFIIQLSLNNLEIFFEIYKTFALSALICKAKGIILLLSEESLRKILFN